MTHYVVLTTTGTLISNVVFTSFIEACKQLVGFDKFLVVRTTYSHFEDIFAIYDPESENNIERLTGYVLPVHVF